MNRREFLTGIITQVIPPKSDDLMTRILENESALDNLAQATFMRDEAILVWFATKFGEELGLTYYGQIIDLVGRSTDNSLKGRQ